MKNLSLKIWFLNLALLASSAAFSIGEGNYARDYANLVQPFYDHQGVAGTFSGVDGVAISYRKFELPVERGAVVILPGRTEPARKFAEIILDTVAQGYSVYIIDHRGQGESGRMTQNSNVGYVRKFDDYVQDLNQFVTQVVTAKPHYKLYLLAHSLGGAIGAKYLINYPGVFRAAALNSPMLKINTAPYPEWVAQSIVGMAIGVGQGKKYAIGQKDYDFGAVFDEEKNELTHSEARWNQELKTVSEMPALALGGVSNRWLYQSLLATHFIKHHAKSVATPVLILQAGQDKVVKNDGENYFCSHAKNCTVQAFPGARHEILQEVDSIRSVALHDIFAFFTAH